MEEGKKGGHFYLVLLLHSVHLLLLYSTVMLLVAADRRLSAATSSKQIEQGPFSPLQAQITMPHEDETTTTTTSIVFAIQFFTNPLTVSSRLGRPFPFQSIKERRQRIIG
jgi:hypothetical protein